MVSQHVCQAVGVDCHCLRRYVQLIMLCHSGKSVWLPCRNVGEDLGWQQAIDSAAPQHANAFLFRLFDSKSEVNLT
eukprot:scaffold66891_cov24-Prasinocladus_malaysianus.AAC.1